MAKEVIPKNIIKPVPKNSIKHCFNIFFFKKIHCFNTFKILFY
jgi:hypothetical protein